MPFTVEKINELLDDAIDASDNPGGKKVILDELYQSMGIGSDSLLDPAVNLNLNQALDIVTKILILTEREVKDLYTRDVTLRGRRVAALTRLYDWHYANRDFFSPIFSSVARSRIAVQVAFRIRRPNSINQGPQGFCGPASILVPLIRKDPVAYVDFVTDLVETGRGQFGTRTVDVRQQRVLRQSWFAGKGPEADYVALGSLRADVEALVASDATGGIAFALNDTASHATTPTQMVRLLQEVGYTNLQDRTLSDFTTVRDHMGTVAACLSANSCANHLTSHPGSVVIMLVSGSMASYAKRGRAMGVVAPVQHLHQLHWILVKKLSLVAGYVGPNSVPQGTVDMKLYTWKWSGRAQYPMADFLPRYFGYVSADPV